MMSEHSEVSGRCTGDLAMPGADVDVGMRVADDVLEY